MQYKILLLSLLMTVSIFAQNNVRTTNELLDSIIHSQNKKNVIYELKLDSLQQVILKTSDELTNLKSELPIVKNRFDSLVKELQDSNKIMILGATLLLIGLFIEVIGAVLLSGSALSEEAFLILDPKLPIGSTTLEFKSTKENVMGFYGVIGSILLVLGFVIQFIGTALVLKIPIWILILGSLILLFLAFRISIYLMKKSKNQSFKEKLSIFISNASRIFVYPIKAFLAPNNRIVCDLCHNYCNTKIAQIGYVQTGNPRNLKEFHVPYDVAIGHKDCIISKLPVTKIQETAGYTRITYNYDLAEFLNEIIEELRNNNNHRLQEGRPKSAILDHSLERIERVLSKKKIYNS